MEKEKVLIAYVAQLAKALIVNNADKATKYVSPDVVIKAKRIGKLKKNSRIDQVLITYGKPNYRERKFIAVCKKAEEPFPVSKIQLKYSGKAV